MLRFIKHNLATIDGVGLYAIISFLIFFSIFIGMLIYVFVMPKSKVEELSNLPLDNNNLNDNNYEQQ